MALGDFRKIFEKTEVIKQATVEEVKKAPEKKQENKKAESKTVYQGLRLLHWRLCFRHCGLYL